MSVQVIMRPHGHNKEDIMKKAILLIIVILVCVSLFGQYNPKNVGIYIMHPSGGIPADGTITFTATIEGTAYSVDQDDVGCGYKALSTRGLCYVNMASFGYEWAQDDVINWVISDTGSREELGNVNQTVATGDGTSQYDTDYWGGSFLPVTLSSFTAVYQNGTPVLQWITQSEINNSGWNVYRSELEDMESSLQVNAELISGAGTSTEIVSYQFTDELDVENGIIYYYQLESVDYLGNTEQYGPISIMIPEDNGGQSPEVPIVYGLHTNYPNPFNPETKICYIPQEEGYIELDIVNIKGQKVKTLCNDYIASDQVGKLQSHIWDGKNELGRYVSSGIYFYQYKSNTRNQIRKMLLIK